MSINTHDYENDVRVMTGAFYPGVKIVIEHTPECIMQVLIHVEGPHITGSVIDGDNQYDIDVICENNVQGSIRNLLKRELYEVYSKLTGKELPWGTLTGIRPIKIPLALVEQGMEDEDVISHFKSEYLVCDNKSRLGLAVAKNEHKLLKKLDYKNGYSLYIGIPFCPTTCLYCSFTSYPISMWKNKVDDYLEALFKELSYLSNLLKNKKPDSIYIGGGTPTTLLPHQFERLFDYLFEHFDVEHAKEFTVEAGRPDSIDRDKLQVIRRFGIDRISVNPQTMNQRTLDFIGRRHTVEDVCRAFWLARDCGFENINMDLIVGLPGETRDDVKYTLEEVAKLDPDSLTVHSLAIKRAAALNMFRDQYADCHIENTDEIMDMTYDFAVGHGLEPYYLYRQKNMAGNLENVGYSKPGKAGIYNILIMEEKQSIFAAGANSQSKIVFPDENRVERIENVKDVTNYIERVDEMIERKRTFFHGENELR